MNIPEDQDIRINNFVCRGLIVKENKILVMFRRKKGEEYYVFPGGHMRKGETPEETVIREIKEETTVDCAIQRKAYEYKDFSNIDSPQTEYFYICDYLRGIPKLSGEESRRCSDADYYKPLWLDLNSVPSILIYPVQSKAWVIANLLA